MDKFVNVRNGREEQATPGTMLHRALVKDGDWKPAGSPDEATGDVSALDEVQSKAELNKINRDELDVVAEELGLTPGDYKKKGELVDAVRAAQATGGPPAGSYDEEGDLVRRRDSGVKSAEHEPGNPDQTDPSKAKRR